MHEIMELKLWYHISESMISVCSDIKDLWYQPWYWPWFQPWYGPWYWPWYHCQPTCYVRWQITQFRISWWNHERFQCEYARASFNTMRYKGRDSASGISRKLLSIHHGAVTYVAQEESTKAPYTYYNDTSCTGFSHSFNLPSTTDVYIHNVS